MQPLAHCLLEFIKYYYFSDILYDEANHCIEDKNFDKILV